MLQQLDAFLGVRGSKLSTGLDVWPYQCQGEGESRCPGPAGHAILDTGQDAISSLGSLGTLFAHVQVAVVQVGSDEWLTSTPS